MPLWLAYAAAASVPTWKTSATPRNQRDYTRVLYRGREGHARGSKSAPIRRHRERPALVLDAVDGDHLVGDAGGTLAVATGSPDVSLLLQATGKRTPCEGTRSGRSERPRSLLMHVPGEARVGRMDVPRPNRERAGDRGDIRSSFEAWDALLARQAKRGVPTAGIPR